MLCKAQYKWLPRASIAKHHNLETENNRDLFSYFGDQELELQLSLVLGLSRILGRAVPCFCLLDVSGS